MVSGNGVERCTEIPVARSAMEQNGVHQRAAAIYSKRSVTESNRNESNNQNNVGKVKMDRMLEEGGVIYEDHKEEIRFIKKSGHCNVSHMNLYDKRRRFLADIFTTGVDLKWRWNLLVFSAAFIVSWLLFGLVFWFFSYFHGDFEARLDNSTFRPCIKELDIAYPFTSTFLFSLETQTTIGYGFRHVTEECWYTIIVVVLQSVFGCILDAFMIGLIMAKISRPKKRAETLLFSHNAVINIRDGRLCFMIRVGNLRKSHLVEATIRKTLEGEYIPLEQSDLDLDLKNDSDRLFLVTPQTICHPIDADSPFWSIGEDDLNTAKFEVIVILEGMVEATGMTTQARASYLPSEILWGHRFHNMISLSRNNAYKVNFKKFHDTYPTCDAPKCSAKEFFEASKPRTNSVVTLRQRRTAKHSSSGSSSSRSSTASQRAYSMTDEGVSRYSTLDTIVRSNSKNSLNKPMTSCTSLSDDSDRIGDGEKRSSMRSSSSSLIDLSSPKPPDADRFVEEGDHSTRDNGEDVCNTVTMEEKPSQPQVGTEKELDLLILDSPNPDSNILPDHEHESNRAILTTDEIQPSIA